MDNTSFTGCLFGPLGILAYQAMYFACVNFCFFYIFFLNGAKLTQDLLTDLHNFSPNDRYLRVCDRCGLLFLITRDVAMAGKIWVYAFICHNDVPKRIAISLF